MLAVTPPLFLAPLVALLDLSLTVLRMAATAGGLLHAATAMD